MYCIVHIYMHVYTCVHVCTCMHACKELSYAAARKIADAAVQDVLPAKGHVPI